MTKKRFEQKKGDVMSNDLISRKSVLDYIEKEISTARSTETISYLRALSIHINEFEPTAYDVDKVVEQLEERVKEAECEIEDAIRFDYKLIAEEKRNSYEDAIDIVKAGETDD